MNFKLLIYLILTFSVSLFSQKIENNYFVNRSEIYFKFKETDKQKINSLSKVISIDNVIKDSVFAYSNQEEFNNFLNYKIQFTILPHPGDVKNPKMSNELKDILEWNYYPTYEAYLAMMYQFQTQYPNLCRIVEIGNTVQGRKILFAKISDNVDSNEVEPEFQYSSSMHGDETTGYILMLRLINHLLTNYGIDQEATDLVNNNEIWINPLANPDGTYRGGNSTVSGATRYNYNNVDLNRNYPDPAAGPHPDGKSWQPETIAMINFFKQHSFVLSANFHGGAEVVNYPWDTWARLHADDSWLYSISRAYADTVHLHSPSNYMTFLNNGITNGYAWYRVTGGRQDYMTNFIKGREITIELSNTKLLSASLLPAHWDYNYRSLLNFMKFSYYGIVGTVKDISGKSIRAKIYIQNHEADSSEAYSDSISGNYYRLVAPGNYTLIVSAQGYSTQIFENIQVSARTPTNLNITLSTVGTTCSNIELKSDWNIISVPVKSNNMNKNFLFPNSISSAYSFDEGYNSNDTLINSKGYWIKFPSDQTIQIYGSVDTTNKVNVKAGWNLVGSFDKKIISSGITSTPTGIILTPFYEYTGAYNTSDTLKPGKGYWIKVSQNGVLNLPINIK